ncbi:hypothetical protein BURMUCGD1_6367 [Burkholderia multivorans CGD1]|nr:hypothetical protein BURMUCGD1_6367 [Burkholderia multivorans CGD1]
MNRGFDDVQARNVAAMEKMRERLLQRTRAAAQAAAVA